MKNKKTDLLTSPSNRPTLARKSRKTDAGKNVNTHVSTDRQQQIQEAAYFRYLQRLEERVEGSAEDDWIYVETMRPLDDTADK